MSKINKKRESADVRVARDAHLNWMGGQNFDVTNPINRLRMAASSCFFGEPQYYHADKDDKPKVKAAFGPAYRSSLSDSQLTALRKTLDAQDPQEWRGLAPADLMVRAIDAALDFDPEATLKEAVRLRNEEHIRVTPQVILVRAAHHPKVRGTGLVRQYAKQIIKRADEPSTCLAYQLATYGEKAPIPNSLKRALRDALSGFTEYELAKYQMSGRQVKTVDVVNLVHPKSKAVAKLAKKELTNTDQTWEAIVSAGGSSKKSWEDSLGVMGHMALLRNLRNLLDKGINPDQYVPKLVAGAEKGQQLPFRYISAYEAVRNHGDARVADGIEECLMKSLGNLPEFKGRVMSLCDNSGSAQGACTSSMGTMRVNQIANLTGILTGMRADEGHVGIFGDDLKTFAVRKKASVFDQLDQAEKLARHIGQSTENGIWMFWKQAIEKAEHWDHVFVYSDMQAGHGGLYGHNPREYKEYCWGTQHIDVAKLIRQYRAKVNPNVNVYLVQVAGYQDTIVPEFYNRTYILGGWGEGILRFAAQMAKMDYPKQQ